MSKIQNTSSQRSLATWLNIMANEQNDDWPAPVSHVSVQPVIGWLKDEVARSALVTHSTQPPRGNLPLPCIDGIVSNILHQNHCTCYIATPLAPQTINYFFGGYCCLGQVATNRIMYLICCWSQSGVHLLRKVQSPGRELIFHTLKINQKGIKFGIKVDWQFI